jgi:hypothetical protein
MTEQSSKLRSFAINVESVLDLLPKLAREKVITRAQSEFLVTQLKSGVENALDIAQEMERVNPC